VRAHHSTGPSAAHKQSPNLRQLSGCRPRTSRTGSTRHCPRTCTRTRRTRQRALRWTRTRPSRSRPTSTVNPVHAHDHLGRLRAIVRADPRLSAYAAFDDGRTLLLLCIYGTLPITYSSARYNVPVNVWFPLDYPQSPPMVYVVPTSGMMVRKGRGVALDGKVEEEKGSYLDGWRRKPEVSSISSTNQARAHDQPHLHRESEHKHSRHHSWYTQAHSILPLLQSLIDSFSIQPPVYAKPKTTATSGPSPAQSSASSSPVRANTAPQSHYAPHPEVCIIVYVKVTFSALT
jgi:hypothetical protein